MIVRLPDNAREAFARSAHEAMWGRNNYDTDVHWAPITRIVADAILALCKPVEVTDDMVKDAQNAFATEIGKYGYVGPADKAMRAALEAALAASGSESDANNPKDKCAWPTPWGTCEAYRHEHYPSSQHQFVEPQPPALPSRDEIVKAIVLAFFRAENKDVAQQIESKENQER